PPADRPNDRPVDRSADRDRNRAETTRPVVPGPWPARSALGNDNDLTVVMPRMFGHNAPGSSDRET
ncbi:hypothetical protein ACFQ0D_18695, partial [Micromonospora zhanjiangensis]